MADAQVRGPNRRSHCPDDAANPAAKRAAANNGAFLPITAPYIGDRPIGKSRFSSNLRAIARAPFAEPFTVPTKIAGGRMI
jgi:hypothetical protein